jgi:predicted DNA-binding protein
MTRNVTIRLDEAVLKRCRHLAVEDDKSLSEWIRSILIGVVTERTDFSIPMERAVERLDKGFNLGGRPLSREEIYER